MKTTVKTSVKKVVANQKSSSKLSNKLSSAIEIRKDWSANFELQSNKMLYEILSSCYVVYDEYIKAEDKRQWKADFYEAIKIINKDHEKYHVESKLTLTIVRVVFGDSNLCRQRVSTYAKVLRIAGDNGGQLGVTAKQFAKWIETRGGVQEISRSAEVCAKETTDKVAHVKKRLLTLGTVNKIDAVKSIDLQGNYMLLLVSVDKNDMTVKHVFNDAEYVDSAMRKLYGEYKNKEAVQNKVIDIKRNKININTKQESKLKRYAA